MRLAGTNPPMTLPGDHHGEDASVAKWAKARHKDRKSQEHADEVADITTRISLQLAGFLLRVRDCQSGQPRAQTYGAPTGSSGYVEQDEEGRALHSDPTGDAAITPDRARLDESEIHNLLSRMHRDANLLADIFASYNPKPATAQQRRDADAENQRWCESCARVNKPDGTPATEFPDSRRKGPTTLGGKLEKPMWLCGWCANKIDQVTKLEGQPRLPHIGEVQDHLAYRPERVRVNPLQEGSSGSHTA